MAKEKMELWQYLASLKIKDRSATYGKFAEKVKISRSRLSRIINYREPPSHDLADRIQVATNHQVLGWELTKLCKEGQKRLRDEAEKCSCSS